MFNDTALSTGTDIQLHCFRKGIWYPKKYIYMRWNKRMVHVNHFSSNRVKRTMLISTSLLPANDVTNNIYYLSAYLIHLRVYIFVAFCFLVIQKDFVKSLNYIA